MPHCATADEAESVLGQEYRRRRQNEAIRGLETESEAGADYGNFLEASTRMEACTAYCTRKQENVVLQHI